MRGGTVLYFDVGLHYVARALWEEHSDDLCLDSILDTFEKELPSRGLIKGQRPAPDAFARLMVETFIRFPGAESGV